MRRRAILMALAVALAVTISVTQAPPVAHASDFEVSGTFTYTVDPQSNQVHVSVDIEAKNNDVRHWVCYGGFSMAVPFTATNIVSNERTWPHNRIRTARPRVSTWPDHPGFLLADVGFRLCAGWGSIRSITITYDLGGRPPRGDGTIRMNSAYFGFQAFTFGEPGRATLKVVAPSNYVVDTLDDQWQKASTNGITTYTRAAIPEPDKFAVFVAAHDDTALERSEVATADHNAFTVQSWPGDVQWQQFVTAQIQQGVPELQTLVGVPWPIDTAVAVRESATPYVYGYAGWFSATKHEIEIGENLDQEVVLHEMSHAWFNRNWFSDRWLDEGFAQVYSNLAVGKLGGTAHTPIEIATNDPGRVTLNDWSDPDFTDGAGDRERFGYNASFWVVQQIVDEIGVDKMQTVLKAVADGTPAYLGPDTAERTDAPTGWERFLDLVERVGGSKTATTLFQDQVVTAADRSLFDQRATAQSAYTALTTHGAEWAPPAVVRTQMGDWKFTYAAASINASEACLVLRDQLGAAVQEIGTTYTSELRSAYESASGPLDAVTAKIQVQLDLATVMLKAARADRSSHGILGSVGLLGNDIDATLNEARDAFARGDLATAEQRSRKVIDAVDGETSAGLLRVGIAVALVAAATVLMRRRRRVTASTNDDGDAELEANVDVQFDGATAAAPVAAAPTLDPE